MCVVAGAVVNYALLVSLSVAVVSALSLIALVLRYAVTCQCTLLTTTISQYTLLSLPIYDLLLHVLLLLLDGLFSRTTWVSWYQKSKTSLDFNGARDDGILGCSGICWTMQTICTSLQMDSHTNTSSLNFYSPMLLLMPKQQCQSTEGIPVNLVWFYYIHTQTTV